MKVTIDRERRTATVDGVTYRVTAFDRRVARYVVVARRQRGGTLRALGGLALEPDGTVRPSRREGGRSTVRPEDAATLAAIARAWWGLADATKTEGR